MKKVFEDMREQINSTDINVFGTAVLLQQLYYGKVDYKTFRRIIKKINRINRKQKELRKEK